MTTFSTRTAWPSDLNPLISLFNQLKNEKVPIFNLTESNPTHGNLANDPEGILSPLGNKKNLYYDPEPMGSLLARKRISEDYQRQGKVVNPDQIILTASTSEAYSFLFRLLFNPHERISLPCPSYPLFEFLGHLNDLGMDSYFLRYQQGWNVDIDSIKASIGPKTKAIVLVHPNNPTGSYIKKEELREINVICQHHGLSLICDEVFLDYLFIQDSSLASSLVSNRDVLTFVLGGLSKSLGLPQMKISWIIVNGPNEQLREALRRLEIIADTYLSVNTPAQNALGQWFEMKFQIQGNIQKNLEENREIFSKFFSPPCPAQALLSEGGWYGILRLPSHMNEEHFAMTLLQEEHVFVHPGYFFDFSDWPCCVISFLTSHENFAQGLGRIKKYF